jgi:CheY-like chemotaxis protein
MKHLVLIVDDDPALRTGMALLVKAKGHEATTAATVREGIERLGSGPTHLLLDMNLPDGPGTAILRHVRAAKLPVKVAVLSGSTDAAMLAEAEALGPDAVFRKPPAWDAVADWIAA